MKRLQAGIFGTIVAGVAAATAVVGFGGAKPALACSGPPPHWQLAASETVIAGRIVAANEDPAAGDTSFRQFDILIEVEHSFRGAGTGERLATIARVPRPGVPMMCPQFDRDETFIGKFVVSGLSPRSDQEELYQWGTIFMGHDTSGSEYSEAIQVAAMATGTSANGPQLSASVGGQRCGGIGSIRGARFEPGQELLLNYPYPVEPGPDGIFRRPTVRADSSGRFEVQFRLPADWCPLETFVEAYAWRDGGQSGGWPLAMASLSASQAAAPLPPDVGNSPRGLPGSDWAEVVVAAAIAGVVAMVAVARRGLR